MPHDDDYVTRNLMHTEAQQSEERRKRYNSRELRHTHGRSHEDALRAVTAEDIMRLHDETMQVLDRWMNGGPN